MEGRAELAKLKIMRLNMDSGQFDLLCNQQGEQAFTSVADVVHELKAAQIPRHFLLRDTTMGS